MDPTLIVFGFVILGAIASVFGAIAYGRSTRDSDVARLLTLLEIEEEGHAETKHERDGLREAIDYIYQEAREALKHLGIPDGTDPHVFFSGLHRDRAGNLITVDPEASAEPDPGAGEASA